MSFRGADIDVATVDAVDDAAQLGALELGERAMLRLKVKALTAEGRLSAIFLTAMPFVLFGVITLLQPAYFFSVRNHPIIMPALILGLSMIGAGNVMIYRMVNFKV